MSAALSAPSGFFGVNFTVDEASAYFRCTDGLGVYASTPTVASIKGGTTCSAAMYYSNPASGNFCSGSCSSGQTTSVLTYAQLSKPPSFVLDSKSLACSSDTGSLAAGLIQAVEAAAGQAVQQLFNGLPLSSNSTLHTPWIPSGACATTSDVSNTQFRGVATQVGSAKNNGHILLKGQFYTAGPVSLEKVDLTLEQAMFEQNGVGELVRNDSRNAISSIKLQPQKGSTATHGIYATAAGMTPEIHADIQRITGNAMEYSIDISRATMTTFPGCAGSPPAAQLATSFSLTGDGDPIKVSAVQRWQCGTGRLSTP